MNYYTLVIVVLLMVGCATSPKENGKASTVALLEQADRNYKNGLLSEAESDYLKLSKMAPNVPDAWFKLGNIYVRTGYLDAAVRMYSKCLEVDKHDSRCWNNLAVARVKQSMETLQQGKSELEKNSDDYYLLDRLYQKLVDVIAVKEK